MPNLVVVAGTVDFHGIPRAGSAARLLFARGNLVDAATELPRLEFAVTFGVVIQDLYLDPCAGSMMIAILWNAYVNP